MIYRNGEIKIDQLVEYLNKKKINLSPAFQRGHVWEVRRRKKLIKNMLQGKPIPAIFLYKEEAGSTYSYNILDGKQRLESIILFIGNQRKDLTITKWKEFFYQSKSKESIHFTVDGKAFRDLEEADIRDFSEYVIPTIEIDLDENSSLDEIISLFVDINQQGVAVNRFDIIKAMYKNDKILEQVFKLIAVEQRRGEDVYYKMINSDMSFVLKRLTKIANTKDNNAKVDKMWERLLELSIYTITDTHKKPVEILKEFISHTNANKYKLNIRHIKTLRKVFKYLKNAYKNTELGNTKFAADQTHFYTLITSLLSSDLINQYGETLVTKLIAFARYVDNPSNLPKNIKEDFTHYMETTARHTTDTSNRKDREDCFYKILCKIEC